MPEKLHTVAEAADLLCMSEDFIRKRIAHRQIDYVKIGAAVRIPATELDRLVAQGRVPAASNEKSG